MYKTKETAIRNLRRGKNFGTKPFDLFRSNREVVSEAVKINPMFIGDADSKFRDDLEIMALASKLYPALFHISSERLRANKAFCMEALSHHGSILQYLSSELQGDLEVVEIALKSDGGSLRYASEKIKDNRKLVLLAVINFGYALQYASDRLKADKVVVLKALSVNLTIPGLSVELEKLQKICLMHASTEIQELCRGKDPVAALQAAINMERLHQKLTVKDPSGSIRLKI